MLRATFILEIVLPTGVRQVLTSAGMPGTLGATDIFAIAGLKPSNFEVTRSLEDKFVTITIPLQNDLILELSQGLISDSVQSGSAVKYSYVLDGIERVLMYGTIDSAQFTDVEIQLKISSFINAMGRGKVVRLDNSCSKIFGSPACGFDLTTVTQDQVIDTIAPDRLSLTFQDPTAQDINFFADGTLFLLPRNAGVDERIIELDIALSQDNRIFLWETLPSEFVSGDQIQVAPGCRKDEDNCKFYNNFLNFNGIPPSGRFYSPTELDVLAGARS